MKDELKLKLHFTTSEEPKECKRCQWGQVEPFEGLDGNKRYGVSCFIPDLEAMKGECLKKLVTDTVSMCFYSEPAGRIMDICHARGIFMRRIADICNIGISRVSYIINGYDRPTASELDGICGLLKLSDRERSLYLLNMTQSTRQSSQSLKS